MVGDASGTVFVVSAVAVVAVVSGVYTCCVIRS